MAMFLIVGCQTIEAQLPEETKPEETNVVVNTEEVDTPNLDEIQHSAIAIAKPPSPIS